MAKALGVGGVFFKSEDPEKLGKWYQKWLAVPVEHPYGASFKPEGLPPGGMTVWAPFSGSTTYFEPSTRDYMFNLIVDDVEEALSQVAEGGAEIVGEIQDEYDEEEILITKLGPGLYLVDGSVAIRYINRRYGLALSEEHVNTLAGFLLDKIGSIPEEGDLCEVDGARFTVREVVDRRIEKIEMQVSEEEKK